MHAKGSLGCIAERNFTEEHGAPRRNRQNRTIWGGLLWWLWSLILLSQDWWRLNGVQKICKNWFLSKVDRELLFGRRPRAMWNLPASQNSHHFKSAFSYVQYQRIFFKRENLMSGKHTVVLASDREHHLAGIFACAFFGGNICLTVFLRVSKK